MENIIAMGDYLIDQCKIYEHLISEHHKQPIKIIAKNHKI